MKKLLFLIGVLFWALQVSAADVSVSQAQAAANSFLTRQVRAGSLKASAASNLKLVKAEASVAKPTAVDYYIFNSEKSYVIVAGDDQAPQILMYGEEGPLDLDNIPPGMQWLLNKYKYQIDGLKAGTMKAVAAPRVSATAVAPLVTANWDQTKPYYNHTPTSGSTHAYTGCPATSLAMCFYLYKWPETYPALDAIAANNYYGYLAAEALEEKAADWDNMIDEYTGPSNYSYTSAQAEAVSWLMRYVGQACNMGYSTSGSGANDPEILEACHTFGYTDAELLILTELVQSGWSGYTNSSQYYTDSQWNEYMLNELYNGRPIEYLACDITSGQVSGHAFNVFGCNTSGQYYVNWGWSGDSNGYCTLHNFTTATGATGQSGSYVFNYGEAMIIGIAPPGGATYTPTLTVDPTSLSFTAYAGETATQTFTVTGKNLTGNVTLSVSGTGYTISPSTLTADQAAAGATVTVTYKPTASGTHTGTVTIASDGAESQTVSLSGTASTKPALTATQSSLSFSTSVGSTATKTFVVRGTNLINIVSLTASGEGFSVSPTTIAKSTATNGKTVTVTYTPTEAGTHTGAITITSTDADPITVTLNGTATDNTPLISVSPSSLFFTGVTEQTYTKTFTVTGANLTGNLTLTLNNANGIYSINKTSITASQAASGATVTVTYAPVAAGSTSATVTISGGGATSQTVSLGGTATEPVRTITATPNALTFANVVGETATQTFTVTGENLTGDLTLALNDQNGVYSIEPTTMTAAEATAGKTVTVTYAPTAFGTHNATVTISGGSANAVTVTLAGQADLTKYAPVMLEANDLYVAISRFRAEWTDETPVANVASYTLEVNPKSTEPETPETVLLETADFSSLEAVTDNQGYLSNVVNSASDYLPEGWTVQNGLWINDGFLISGYLSSTTCGLTSPTYDFTDYDKVTVEFSAYSYYASYYGNATIRVKTSAGSQEIELGSDDFSTYRVVLDVAASDQVVFEGVESLFAIENIKIYAGDLTATQNTLMATETGDATYRLIEGIDADTKYYTVENLTEGGTFLYRVKALYVDGTESDWSNIQEVTLFENEHPYQIGDVNHDNIVDVDDVTMLIGYVLGNNTTACPICADVNADNIIDVDDVTALINIVLGNTTQATKAVAKQNYLLAF